MSLYWLINPSGFCRYWIDAFCFLSAYPLLYSMSLIIKFPLSLLPFIPGINSLYLPFIWPYLSELFNFVLDLRLHFVRLPWLKVWWRKWSQRVRSHRSSFISKHAHINWWIIAISQNWHWFSWCNLYKTWCRSYGRQTVPLCLISVDRYPSWMI